MTEKDLAAFVRRELRPWLGDDLQVEVGNKAYLDEYQPGEWRVGVMWTLAEQLSKPDGLVWLGPDRDVGHSWDTDQGHHAFALDCYEWGTDVFRCVVIYPAWKSTDVLFLCRYAGVWGTALTAREAQARVLHVIERGLTHGG